MNQQQLKEKVAAEALEYCLTVLTPTSILGIGTGSTANCFIDLLGSHKHRFAATVASSEASAERLASQGIEVVDLNSVDEIAVYVDGADEVNSEFHLIKGGGGALTREKIVAAASREFVCIVDQSKWVETLGAFPLPVEVIPMARHFVAKELTALGGNPIVREGFITDNGNEILDIQDLKIENAPELERSINMITGVVTNGLFAIKPADRVIST